MPATGKWTQAGVPHRGWSCEQMEDLGEPDFTCEMCEVQIIRYVHTMWHPDYGTLKVGCVCAGHMEQDTVGARQRETGFRARMARRGRWLQRKWRVSAAGNQYLNTSGLNIVVYRRDNDWGARIQDRANGQTRFCRYTYRTSMQAKLAAFDDMQHIIKLRQDK